MFEESPIIDVVDLQRRLVAALPGLHSAAALSLTRQSTIVTKV